VGGCLAPFRGALAGSPSNMWPGPRPTSVPRGILIHPTVWPQYTNVTDRQDNGPIAYRANRFTNGRRKTLARYLGGPLKALLRYWKRALFTRDADKLLTVGGGERRTDQQHVQQQLTVEAENVARVNGHHDELGARTCSHIAHAIEAGVGFLADRLKSPAQDSPPTVWSTALR